MSSFKGVDYDSRCKKFRARLTRNGCVYHLGYFENQEDAVKARKRAESEFQKGNKIDYIHSYATSAVPPEIEDDPYLFFLAFNDTGSEPNPERSLRLSVLVQAVKDLLTDKDRDSQKNARGWFAGEIESSDTYSFEEICEILGIDPGFVRKCLKRAVRNKKKVLRRIGRRLVRSDQSSINHSPQK
tara:strand:- start:2588 stop:3142 length:555 start_codon:yes stop_codon:yes gene_type:complete